MSVPSIEPLLLQTERRIVEALALRSRPVQARFAQREGLWKDARVTITTRTWEGDAIGCFRTAIISGTQLTIGSLLGCARPNRPLPLLLADVVQRGEVRELTITVETIPVLSGTAPGVVQHRAGPEQMAAAVDAFTKAVEGWVTPASAAVPDPDRAAAVRRRQREVLDDRLADPQVRSLLAVMFGKTWADEYVGTVLFPA